MPAAMYSRFMSRIRHMRANYMLTLKVLVIFFLIIVVAAASVSVTSYLQVVQLADRQTDLYARSVAESISGDIDQNIQEMDRIARIVLGNPTVQRFVTDSQSPFYSSQQRLNDLYQVTELILGFTSVRDSFMVQLYSQDLQLLYSGPVRLAPSDYNLLRNDWFAAYQPLVDSQRSLIIPPGKIDRELTGQLFGVTRNLQRIDRREIVGYISVTSGISRLQQSIFQSPLFTREMHVQVDEGSNVLFSDLTGGAGDLARPGRSCLVVSYLSEQTGWRTTVIMPRSLGNSIGRLADLRNALALITIVVILATLALAIVLSNAVFKPLRTMVATMHSVRHGNFDISLDEKGLDYEVRELYSGFNRMVSEIRDLIRRISDEKLVTRAAQMEALQYQISPHFVYNTLQTIEAVGEVYNIAEIQTMAQSLGKILRYNVRGGNIVHLYDEVDQVSTYLNIEKIRYPDRISWSIDVDSRLAGCKVLKFIFQPIVENCVLHGFQNTRERGMISITAQEDDHVLKLSVSDNGRGISPQRLAAIQEKLQQISTSSLLETDGEYVGLFNVHKRIVSYYGNMYGLRYTSNESLGTTVILTLPLVWDGATDRASA